MVTRLLNSIVDLFSKKKPDVEEWRDGSASVLKGKIYTLVCFVSGKDDEWSDEGKTDMLDLLEESQRWIQKQALKYNVTVDFDEPDIFGFYKDIEFQEIVRGTASGNEPVDWVSKVLYKVGYKSTLDLVKNTNAENIQVIIFVQGQGTGYAMASSSGMDKEKYFVEGAVLYETYNNGIPLVSSSIAHEILHLYGAWDLYETFNQTKENERKARELYPYSIMLDPFCDANKLNVDEITAWLIGWHNNPKPEFELFRPKPKAKAL